MIRWRKMKQLLVLKQMDNSRINQTRDRVRRNLKWTSITSIHSEKRVKHFNTTGTKILMIKTGTVSTLVSRTLLAPFQLTSRSKTSMKIPQRMTIRKIMFILWMMTVQAFSLRVLILELRINSHKKRKSMLLKRFKIQLTNTSMLQLLIAQKRFPIRK